MLRYLILEVDNTSTPRKSLVAVIADKSQAEEYCKLLREYETNLAVEYTIEALHRFQEI